MKNIITCSLISFSLLACAPIPDDFRDEAGFAAENEPGFGDLHEEPLLKFPPSEESEQSRILSKYAHLDPNREVPSAALEHAILYYDSNLEALRNKKVMTIIDFSLHSGRKRFFIIDMQTGTVTSFHTAHGVGSDPNHDGVAKKFSNVEGSRASSLGFYTTAETYTGQNGLSLRLDGRSKTNSKARSRAIVIHGAAYVEAGLPKMGRSWGCPALPTSSVRPTIERLKGGSLVYAWIPGLLAP